MLVASSLSVPQIAACAALAVVVLAWSIHLAKRKGRWLAAMGPLAAAALFGALVQWPGPDAARSEAEAPERALEPAVTPLLPERPTREAAVPDEKTAAPALAVTAPAARPGPPPQVVLAGTWAEEDRIVVQSALVRALASVPQARGAILTVEGTGRALPPTSTRAPRYGIAATWTLRAEPGGGVLAADAFADVQGWGATPDQARGDAAIRAGRALAAAIANASPAAP